MTTPWDLVFVAMDMAPSRPVERGDLSLALAGAELIDLYRNEAVRLERGRILPGPRGEFADPLLDDADAALARDVPYERVGDWLWRRGRGLSEAYLAALESEGRAVREQHRRWFVVRTTRLVLVDSPDRHNAANRWAAQEPVLVTLAAGIGIPGDDPDDVPSVTDDTAASVLAAVEDALQELSAERQRRARRRDEAKANNVRRGY